MSLIICPSSAAAPVAGALHDQLRILVCRLDTGMKLPDYILASPVFFSLGFVVLVFAPSLSEVVVGPVRFLLFTDRMGSYQRAGCLKVQSTPWKKM